MKVLHLISGGDTGGAKTHIINLLCGLKDKVEVKLVCFIDGPFAEDLKKARYRRWGHWTKKQIWFFCR